MKLNEDPAFGLFEQDPKIKDLIFALKKYLRQVNSQVNGLTNGDVAVNHMALDTSPPNYITDYVPKKTKIEAGLPGSKYVLKGWIWTGTAYVEDRCLTGN